MRRILPLIQITLGTAMAALAINLFVVPNHLATGGLGGLLLIFHYLWQLPMGPAYFAANLPGLYMLYRIYGMKGLIRTVWGIASFSFFLDALAPVGRFSPTSNALLAVIYAGVVLGLGVGLAISAGGATGGTDMIAQVVKHYTGMDVGRFLLLADIFILGFAAVVLNAEASLYGLLMTFVSSRLVQAVQEGFSTSRCMLIISEHPDTVARSILSEMKRGVTRLQAIGEYSRQPRPVLMCVVTENEVMKIKRLALEADPAAFVVITDAREVSGRGFTLETEIRPLPFWRGM